MSHRHFNNSIMSVSLSSLFLSSIFFFISTAASSKNGFTVDLFHRDSPHSPFYDPSATRFQRLRSAFDRSVSRQAAFTSAASVISPDSFSAPVTRAGGEFMMKIQMGTPPQEQIVVADTGSDLSWIQCKPCLRCYNQTLPLFDPKQSSSYSNVSCESDTCLAAETARSACTTTGRCRYTIRYGDGSYTSGDVAVETLTFSGGVSFPRVAFGCGRNSAGTFEPAGSGIVGLGGGPISLVNQLGTSVGGRFSYCLASDFNTSSKISFGDDAVVDGPNVASTPLVKKKSRDTFYFLTLEAVSVGSVRLNLSSSPTANDDDVEGNIIINSGTTLTYLRSDLYEKVEAEVARAVVRDRVADPQGELQLCYRKESGFKSPTITAHFRGADWVLPEGSIFVEVEEGIVCLTLLPAAGTPIIFGNMHQINYHVGYDTVKNEIRFLPTDCSKPQSH